MRSEDTRGRPWAELKRRPDLRLVWITGPVDGGWRPGEIWINVELDRTGRRCALAHELIHAERGIPTCDGGPLAQREEAIVRAETARRLVPAAELEPWVAHRVEAGHQVTVADVATEWDVTPEVAHEAIGQLARRTAA